MKSAVAIRHVAFEDVGAFAPAIGEAGYTLRYLDIGEQDPGSPKFVEADLLIVLGGPIGANDDASYPFLKDEIEFLTQRLDAGRPTMGICLGAQLIARAAGAKVYPSSAKEIGFAPIALTDAGRRSCLQPFADDPMTLHWHGDTFDLPGGAERLASSAVCENQAFAMGANVIGFQFHPEASAQSIEKWLIGHAAELKAAGTDIQRLRAEAKIHEPALTGKAHRVATAWLKQLQW